MFSSPSIHVVHIQVPRLDEVTLIHKYPDMDDTTKDLQDISHLGLLIYRAQRTATINKFPGIILTILVFWFGLVVCLVTMTPVKVRQ